LPNFVGKLPVATNSSLKLVKYALSGRQAIYLAGNRYKKVEVIVLDIVLENQIQGSLFDRPIIKNTLM
jgi:DNA polymerase V